MKELLIAALFSVGGLSPGALDAAKTQMSPIPVRGYGTCVTNCLLRYQACLRQATDHVAQRECRLLRATCDGGCERYLVGGF